MVEKEIIGNGIFGAIRLCILYPIYVEELCGIKITFLHRLYNLV